MSSNIKSTLVDTTSKVGFLTIIGFFIRFPVKILTASILNPIGYGLLALAGLIIKYSGYLDFGAHLRMSREIPILLGNKDTSQANKVANIVFVWMSFLTLLVSAFFFLVLFFGINIFGPLSLVQVILIFLIIFFARITKFLSNYIRAYGIFDGIPIKYGIISIILPIITLILAYFYNVNGALLSELLASIFFLIFLCYYFFKINFSNLIFSIHPKEIISYVIGSSQLFLKSILTEFYRSFELIFVALFFSIINLGYYSFALGIYAALFGVISSVVIILERNILHEFGEGKSKTNEGKSKTNLISFSKYFESNYTVYLFFLTVIFGLSFIAFSEIIRMYLKNYEPSIIVANIIYIEIVIYYCSNIHISFINGIGMLKINSAIMFTALSSKLLILLLLINIGFDIDIYHIAGISIIGAITLLFISSNITSKEIYSSRIQGIFMSLMLLVNVIVVAYIIRFLSLFQLNLYSGDVPTIIFLDFLLVVASKCIFFVLVSFLLINLIFFKYKPYNEMVNFYNTFSNLYFNKDSNSDTE